MLSFKTSKKIHQYLRFSHIECEYKYTNTGELIEAPHGHYYNDEYKAISEDEADELFWLWIIKVNTIYSLRELIPLYKQIDKEVYTLFTEMDINT